MSNEEHYLLCPAPICAGDPNPNFKSEVIWYPGEPVCKQGPYTKFQKIQKEINELVKLGKFKNMDCSYTVNDLENHSI